MAIYYGGNLTQYDAHTIKEFINYGSSDGNTGYLDLSFYEQRDDLEFIVKPVLDDYIDDLIDESVSIDLSSSEVNNYKYNPKKLSYDLYGSVKFYFVILRLNNMCNVHDFTISNKKLLLLPKTRMAEALSIIYKANNQSISTFNNYHSQDEIPKPVTKYK